VDLLAILAARHISGANCTEITRDRPGQYAYKIFSIKHKFLSFDSLGSKNQYTRALNRSTPFKILAFGYWNGSSHTRWWCHPAYVNALYPMSFAGIGELRFCLQRAFKHALLSRVPLCVSWAFLYLLADSKK